jgi:hypothetical protein
MKTIVILIAFPLIAGVLIALIAGVVLMSPILLIGFLFWLKNKKRRPMIQEVKKSRPDPVSAAMNHFFTGMN